MEDLQKLREHYEMGIRSNEEFRQHLEKQILREIPQSAASPQNLQEITNLSRELNTAYRKNEELRAQLQVWVQLSCLDLHRVDMDLDWILHGFVQI